MAMFLLPTELENLPMLRLNLKKIKKKKRFYWRDWKRCGGIAYKGVLSNKRIVAIKRLNEANQGECEFLADVSIIGQINHMNMIEMWEHCIEGKDKRLVYEYMEHGSLLFSR